MERYSKQREIILVNLRKRKDHPTAEKLYEDISKIMPKIGIATVYRNLSSLHESGQILKIETEKGKPDRFDGNIMPHLHFQCTKCNNIEDIFINQEEIEELNDKLRKYTKNIKAELSDFKILLKGKCEKCQKS